MIDRRAQRDSSISIFRIIAVACAICVLVYFIFALVTGIEPIATVIACALLCIFLCIFIFLTLNPDSVRSQYTEETLSVASAMLEDIKGGLTQESARLVCRRILPETRAMTVAITTRTTCLPARASLRKNCCPILPSTRLPHATLSNMASCSRSTVWWMSWARTARTTKSPPALSPPSRWAIVRRHAQVLLQDPARRRPYPVCACLGLCRDLVHAARHPRARGAKGTHSARRGACAAGAD